MKLSYRRNMLDKLLKKHQHLYRGTVLDIGGRDRGKFIKPRDKVKKWIFADIEAKYKPDVVLDIENMRGEIEDESIDVINALELFEHVRNPEKGLSECYRVLKMGGDLIISAPFLYRIHADPHDFQRWTADKWERELGEAGFKTMRIEIMGFLFTVLADINRDIIKSLPSGLRHLCSLLSPLLRGVASLDNLKVVQRNVILNKYHGGYFIVCSKMEL